MSPAAAPMVRTSQSMGFPFPLIRILEILLAFLGLGIVYLILSMYMIQYFGGVQNAAVPSMQSSRDLPSFEEPSSLSSWIRPPSSSLLHSMNDRELFWRASFASGIQDYPFNRTPKIAFMFLTRGPLPMAPLWERFFKGHGSDGLYSIYLHSLPTYRPDFAPSSVFYGRQIPSQVAEWGQPSLVDAERRLLANALLDISNEWFVLLSEACIPLYSFSSVYLYISKSRYSFVDSTDDNGPIGRWPYNKKMAPEVNITEWRKGSQWFETNRKLAIDIVKDNIFYPKFARFCKKPCFVDEHYLPTMLSIQSPNLLANRSLTWVDWSRARGPHPPKFGTTDIQEELFKRIFEGKPCSTYNDQPSSVCYLFARKFAPSALEPLLHNASRLFGY